MLLENTVKMLQDRRVTNITKMLWGINNSNHGSRYKRMHKVEFVRDKRYGMLFLPDSKWDRLLPTLLSQIHYPKDHNRQKRRV